MRWTHPARPVYPAARNRETRLLHRAAWLLALALSVLPGVAAAQRFDGTVAGTLDCPARSLFESGSTQVRGIVRNNQLTVGLGPLSVTGRIMDLGPQPAVRLEGASPGHVAAFDGLVVGGNQLHARGIFDERPCNLNLTLSIPPTAPGGRQAVQPVPARGLPDLDGPWQGTVTCPLQDLDGNDRIAARGSVSGNVLSVDFASIRAQGRIAGLSPRPALRIEGGNTRGVGAGFDATLVTPQRIEARGLVGGQPCQMVLTPARLTPPAASVPPPAPPPPAPSVAKPAPSTEPPPVASGTGKPAPSNTPPREAEPQRAPPVATVAPRPVPAAPAPQPPPAPQQEAAPRGPSGAAADQLACALAGTCASPGR
jgi:hypothetical protein